LEEAEGFVWAAAAEARREAPNSTGVERRYVSNRRQWHNSV